ncbi:EamA family transporter RarD [Thioclava sp. GXIMD2076]|uniref:EamA family transporter RarD n=1 Tax=Thioclava sp. GXIMD2076 TaxID=3131931 RepID=UPI0030D3E583
MMSEAGKGVIAMVVCCTMWGLSGLFFAVLREVPVIEVLAHRTLWSAILFLIILALTGRLAALREALRPRSLMIIALAAIFISGNWFTYVWAIQHNHAVEASFGYYIFPLLSVLLGVLVLRERLGRLQLAAIALVTLAVLYMGIAEGHAPVIPLVIAVTFGLYGLIKKQLRTEPLVTVTVEVLVLAPISAVYLLGLELGWFGPAHSGHFGRDATETAFLLLSAGMTAVPLMLFSYAAQRLRLATVGLMQYLNPSLQLFVAVLVLQDPLSQVQMVVLPLIWVALALYSVAGFRAGARKAAPAP